jgi:hypothetical protein
MNEQKLLAFKSGRRSVGLAVFSGLTLECTFVRQLSANGASARQSAVAFVRWALDTFPADAAVVEESVAGAGERRSALAAVIRAELGGCVREITVHAPDEVLAKADRPARPPRKELRELACSLWPAFVTRPVSTVALDAAILGFYRQVHGLLDQ